MSSDGTRQAPRTATFGDRQRLQEPVNESAMSKLVLVGPAGVVICVCHLADRPHTRLRGVIGWKPLRRGEGVLLRPTFSIHTLFVRFPIDAVFLDGEMKVIGIRHHLKPWRLAGAWHSASVLELAAGECDRLGVKLGDRLGWAAI